MRSVSIFDTIKNMTTSHIIDNNNNNNNDNKKLLNSMKHYIKDNVNGYLIPVTNSSSHIKNIIIDAYNNPDKLHQIGINLKNDVILKFQISDEVFTLYERLIN